jgi:hypothetical protein
MRGIFSSIMVAVAIAFAPLLAPSVQAQSRTSWKAYTDFGGAPSYKALLTDNLNSITIVYDQEQYRVPRGSILFSGRRSGNTVSGILYVRLYDCGGPVQELTRTYRVDGAIQKGGTEIVLVGDRPFLKIGSPAGCVDTGTTNRATTTLSLLDLGSPLWMEAPYVPPPPPPPPPLETITVATSADPAPHPLSLPDQIIFIALPFHCSVGPTGITSPQTSLVYHQVLDYEPPRDFSMCPDRGAWGTGFGSDCNVLKLSSFRVVCRGGPVKPTDLSFQGGSTHTPNLTLSNGQLQYQTFRYNQRLLHLLPVGWGLISVPSKYIALPKERVLGPNYLASPVSEPPRTFSTWLANATPVPQLVLAVLFLAVAALAAVGFVGEFDALLSPNKRWYWVFLAFALLSVFLTATVMDAPRAAYRAAQSDMAILRGVFKLADGGYVQPITESDFSRAMQIINQPRPPSDDVAVFGPVVLFLVPALLFSLLYLPRILVGWHYMFTRHAAEPITAPALRSRSLFDSDKLAGALADPSDIERPPPAYKSRNLFRRARALNEKIVQDGEIADAAMERDRARAQAMQAKARLRELRKQLPWWRRWSV